MNIVLFIVGIAIGAISSYLGYKTFNVVTKEYVDKRIEDVKTSIPTNMSELINDCGFLTEHQQVKTINGQSLIGSGNITIDEENGWTPTYDDLSNKPTINEVVLQGNTTTNDLGLVEKNDLDDIRREIPRKVGALSNDMGYITRDDAEELIYTVIEKISNNKH